TFQLHYPSSNNISTMTLNGRSVPSTSASNNIYATLPNNFSVKPLTSYSHHNGEHTPPHMIMQANFQSPPLTPGVSSPQRNGIVHQMTPQRTAIHKTAPPNYQPMQQHVTPSQGQASW